MKAFPFRFRLLRVLAAALPLAAPVRACFPDDDYDDYASGGTSSSNGFNYSELGGGDPDAPAWRNTALFFSDPAPDPDPVYSDPDGGNGSGGGGSDDPAPAPAPPAVAAPDPTPSDPPPDPSPPSDPPPATDPPPAPDSPPDDSPPPPAPAPSDPAPAPPPAPSAAITASPGSGTAPFAALVAWTTANADSAVVAGTGLASSALAGAQTVTLAAGGSYTFTLTASGPGGQVSTATRVTASAARLPQTIAFSPATRAKYPGAAIPLTAAATSGLPVGFTLLSGPGSLQGSQLTLAGPGALVLEASQPGDSLWLPAPDVTATINAQPPPTLVRIRFNAAGRDAHVVNRNAPAGSSFIWTDPGGLLLEPWSAFAGARPAPAGAANTVLPPVPVAAPAGNP
jgi:hypothetical protein